MKRQSVTRQNATRNLKTLDQSDELQHQGMTRQNATRELRMFDPSKETKALLKVDKQRIQFINLISDKIAMVDKLPLKADEKTHVKHVFGKIKAHYEEKTALQLIQNRLEESTYAGQNLAKNGIILLLNNPTSAIKIAPNRREVVKNAVVDLLDHVYKEFTPLDRVLLAAADVVKPEQQNKENLEPKPPF